MELSCETKEPLFWCLIAVKAVAKRIGEWFPGDVAVSKQVLFGWRKVVVTTRAACRNGLSVGLDARSG